jgi:membrane protein insertase Oxa1/YidC/SpoIIIJ
MRLVAIQPQMKAIQAKLKGLNPGTLAHKEARAELKATMDKNGVSLFKTFGYTLITMPFMVVCFMSVRNMVFDPQFYAAMIQGGFSFMPDLKQDAGYAVASVAGLTNFLVFEANNRGEPISSLPQNQQMIRYGFRCAMLISAPCLAYFPFATSVYLVSNNCLSIANSILTRSDWFRRMNKLPTVKEVVEIRLKAQELSARTSSKVEPPANAPSTAYVLPTPRAKAKKTKGTTVRTLPKK